MTTELVTGKAGTPHIGSDDIGLYQAGVSGYGVMRMMNADGTWPELDLQDANHVSIPVMQLLVDGRFVRVIAPETVTIDNGSTGMRRTDLICLKYTRSVSDGVESMQWTVAKGTPSTGTPTTPTVTGGITENATTATYPIASVSLDGITPSQPTMLGRKLTPAADSVTIHTTSTLAIPYTNGMSVGVDRVGRIVTVNGSVYARADFNATVTKVNETIPDGFRPAGGLAIVQLAGANNTLAYMEIKPDGSIEMSGKLSKDYRYSASGTWVSA